MLLFIGILSITGISYALWVYQLVQPTSNDILTGCFGLAIENEQNSISLQNAYPIYDTDGMKLTPYTFSIKNTCSLFVSYQISLEIASDSTLASKYIKVSLNNEEIKKLNEYELDSSKEKETRILFTSGVGQEDRDDYKLRLLIDSEVTQDTPGAINSIFKANIIVEGSVSSYNPVENGYTKLSDAILANEYQTSPEIARQKIASKQAADFTKTAPMIDWQESHASTTSETTAIMPHPDLVGNGEDYTVNLTNKNILPRIGTSYTFDSTTGKYTIKDVQYIDLTTITDYGAKDYYFCNAGFSTNSTDLIQPYQSYTNCINIYKVTSATSEDSQTIGPGGTVIKTRVFKITGYEYSQSELESDKSDKGLYQMEDADGISYYYRGSVKNNYVKFGDFYWRIIRINGDGSIRLLYAGTTPNATGNDLNAKLTDATLDYTNKTTSPFNTIRDTPGYVGYMYGNTLNSSYVETNANDNESTIKKYLDSWYKQNILDKGLSNYIADSGFCNDRSLASPTNYPNNGDGVQTTGKTTYYGGYERYYKTHQPTLVCPNESNDLFTTSSSTKGNQKLTYPIGLITVDELMLSGLADGYLNRLSYTYSSYIYWTLSPCYFHVTNTAASEFNVSFVGYTASSRVFYDYGVRPVINLNADVQITNGIGTENNPFAVKPD